MPGKVNPVMAEMTMQVSIKVMANDTAITMAAAHGEFELNAFLPLVADALLESLELLTGTVRLFREKCIKTLKANEKRCRELLERSHAFAAGYTDTLGYDNVAEIVETYGEDSKAVQEKLQELVGEKDK